MKKVISGIKPFVFKQDILVFEDNNQIDSVSVYMDEYYKALLAIVDKHDVTDVSIAGPPHFVQGLIKRIQEEEKLKYGKNTLNINIVGGK